MGAIARWLAGAAMWGVCLAAAARPGLEFELLLPEKGWRAPGDAFRIRVPPDLTVEVLRRLALELDGIDVTRFLRREGELAVFTPVEPLAYGEHELRIVEYLPDGSIVERAVWKVEVRQSRAFREAEGSLDVGVDLSGRMEASGSLGAGGGSIAQGSLSHSTRIASGEWRAAGDFGLGYDSTGSGSPTGRRVDLQSYNLRFGWRSLGLTAGLPDVFGEGLLGGSYGTRGLGLDVGVRDSRRLRLNVFTMRGEAVSGFREGLGVTDPANRLTGAQIVWFPLAERPERLVIQARTYTGRTPTAGEGVFGDPEEETAAGRALSVTGTLLDGRLRLSAEAARTRWDADGRAPLLRARSDGAYVLGAEWAFMTGASTGTPAEWLLGLRHGQIGPYFRSLLDPGQEADQRASQLTLALRRGGFRAGVALQRVRNNVDGLADLATSRLDSAQLETGYSFSRPALGLLNEATVRATWVRTRPIVIPSGIDPDLVTDDRQRALEFGMAYAFGRLTGSLDLGLGDYRNASSRVPDTRSWRWSLSARRPLLGDRVFLDLSLGRDLTRDDDTGGITRTDQLTLQLAADGLRGGRLGASLAGSLNRSKAPADPGTGTDASDELTRSLSAQLSWRVITPSPRPGRPAVTLGLSAMWQESEERVAGTSSRPWSVNATLRIGAQRRLWQPAGTTGTAIGMGSL